LKDEAFSSCKNWPQKQIVGNVFWLDLAAYKHAQNTKMWYGTSLTTTGNDLCWLIIGGLDLK
jgi:ABC-type transport system involved in cytochrome c biogenesis permease subunit